MKEVDLAVIGAGPAGICAAIEAAMSKASVMLLDENPRPGGQIYRQPTTCSTVRDGNLLSKEQIKGQHLINQLEEYKEKIELVPDALVWNVLTDSKEINLLHGKKIEAVHYKELIIAEGAYDRPVPFPGWTLPGVFTAGGALRMVKTERVLPGNKILLTGTGPLQLVLAKHLLGAGANVVAVLEATSLKLFCEHLPQMWGQWGLIKDGINYLFDLRKRKVPYLMSHAILEARGEQEVKEAVITKLDNNWSPIAGTEETIEVDTICTGYGIIPSVRLSRLCGCQHVYEPSLGAWVPHRDENMESSVPGVFVVGDGASVGGAVVSMAEGRIAAIMACHQLGLISSTGAQQHCLRIKKHLRSLRRFESALNEVTSIRKGFYSRITDDTIICRCEEVTAGEIRHLVAAGISDVEEIKRLTRIGMGNCQGRMCESSIAQIVCLETNQSMEEVGCLASRPPIKPLPLRVLAADE